MSWQLDMALQGNLQEWTREVREGTLDGLRMGLENAAEEGQDLLRADLRAGLPNLSDKTWRTRVFPKSKSTKTWSPTGYIYSKADAIVTAFDEGGEISSDGKLMAVPLPYFQQRLPKNRNRYSKTKVEMAYQMFGAENLEVVPATSDRPAMLVLKSGGVTKTGRIVGRKLTKTGKQRKNSGIIPLFFLVDSVTLQKRLNVEEIFRKVERGFPAHLVRALSITLKDF